MRIKVRSIESLLSDGYSFIDNSGDLYCPAGGVSILGANLERFGKEYDALYNIATKIYTTSGGFVFENYYCELVAYEYGKENMAAFAYKENGLIIPCVKGSACYLGYSKNSAYEEVTGSFYK